MIWVWLKYLNALWSVSLSLGYRTPSSPAAPSGRQSARTGPPTAPAPADSRPAPSGADGSGAPAPGRRHPSGPPSAASPGRSGAPRKAIFQSRVARRRLRPAAARCRLSDSRRRSWLRAAPSPAISAAWPKVSRRGRTWALPEVPGSYRSTRPVSYPSSAHRW